MAIPGSHLDRGVTQSLRYEMNRSARIESVRGMSMAEPMRRNVFMDSGSKGGFSNDAPCCRTGQLRAFLRFKNRGVECINRIPVLKFIPKILRNQDYSCFSAFAEKGDLASGFTRLQIAPLERDCFSHPATADVEDF